ncbi:hypothetical protein [Marinomonas transparens]|uniref:Type VI secretion system lipoprotein TssJ n=1 Tax=Marinomonas transparens TaxID=2795388 RepID=A0A934JZ86_9GAMM|nr:hypothetical protein [Marinomonas transparens]MBJ7540005.1 hypothetical protein [Marinomonas transparens]
MISRKISYGLLCIMALLLAGCETAASLGNSLDKTVAKVVPFYEFNKTLIESIDIQSAANSNNNLPVAVDIIFIFDDKTAEALSALSGPDWFANKKSLLLRYQQQLVMSELEVVPQTAEQKLALPSNYFKAVSVLLFANYLHQTGQYQADITQYHELKIILNKQGYLLKEGQLEEDIL